MAIILITQYDDNINNDGMIVRKKNAERQTCKRDDGIHKEEATNSNSNNGNNKHNMMTILTKTRYDSKKNAERQTCKRDDGIHNEEAHSFATNKVMH